ncbi:hypothetical protein cypCar_00026592 [Cyprinus carpio]|nr:hypothetical protein cypCar_00026592 [Cyprinus carpio]
MGLPAVQTGVTAAGAPAVQPSHPVCEPGGFKNPNSWAKLILNCKHYHGILEVEKMTCLELERYLQTEPKRLSEIFDEELDCLLTPAFMKGDSDEDLMDPLLPSLSDEPSPPPLLVSLPKNLHAPANTKNTEAGLKEASGGVNPAQLNAVTSLTPPSSPELGRHLVKPTQTLTATADGTLTLKLVAKKVGLGAAKLVATHSLPSPPNRGTQSDGEGGLGTVRSLNTNLPGKL